MIDQLKGELIGKTTAKAVVDVGGVGYGLSISLSTSERLPFPGEKILVYTYLYVREDRLDLFGFADTEEREIFQLLIGVSGIGPNSAQTILSGLSVADLKEAIFNDRVGDLTAIKGIGRKTAERMVIELRDKISIVEGMGQTESGRKPGPTEEAALALMALGITPAVSRQAVTKALKHIGPDASLQALIKCALQER
jgi:Holliday junction DNA helicase RuvA